MPELITFDQALQDTADVKRHLLLGNGFSISLFPDKFTYRSLLTAAQEDNLFDNIPEAREAFNRLQTTDFETVIQALRYSSLLIDLYDGDTDVQEKMSQQAEALKELLVRAIAGKHPDIPSNISEEQFSSCRQFLLHFIGESRSRDKAGNVYTLNYDLLLYWTLMHNQIVRWGTEDPLNATIENTEQLNCDDGFRSPEDNHDAEYVTWDGESSSRHSQSIYYLHGALHVFDAGSELQKKCWERSGGIRLIDQIKQALDENKYPLFVSEGTSIDKFSRIRHSAYLHKALRSFASSCNSPNSALFIFGHSLAENDEHILRWAFKGKVKKIYIGLHGEANSENNSKILDQVEELKEKYRNPRPIEVIYFDSASAHVWDRVPE